MPPKGVAKPKGCPPKPHGGDGDAGHNAAIFAKVEAALKVIAENEHFRNCQEAEPIGLTTADEAEVEDGPQAKKKAKKNSGAALTGVQAKFNPFAFQMAMKEGGSGVYRCACNEFWLDPYFSLTGGILSYHKQTP